MVELPLDAAKGADDREVLTSCAPEAHRSVILASLGLALRHIEGGLVQVDHPLNLPQPLSHIQTVLLLLLYELQLLCLFPEVLVPGLAETDTIPVIHSRNTPRRDSSHSESFS